APTGRAGAPGQSPGGPSSAPAPDDFDELTAAAAAAESLLNDTPAPAAPASASPANGADRQPAPMQNRPAQTERDHTAQTARAPQDGQRRGASADGQSSG
ncbi:hypothetical protein DN540_41780, partial [Burkholderia multivorans]